MISAREWNQWRHWLRRSWPIPGRGVRIEESKPEGVVLALTESLAPWEHPWSIRCEWFADPGEWRATVKPGFVNGRDAFIEMPADWQDPRRRVRNQQSAISNRQFVPLTDDPVPWLTLGGWRDPLALSEVDVDPITQTATARAEGYPAFFAQLGVALPARGGDLTNPASAESAVVEGRTRTMRAVDVVLRQPRIGTRLDVALSDPVIDQRTIAISPTFDNAELERTGGRATVRLVTKWTPPAEGTLSALYGTLLDAGDQPWDEVRLATVYLLSPVGGTTEDVPGEQWEPWVQYTEHGFWNLHHATRTTVPFRPAPPLQLRTGLAGGVGDTINAALLSFVNDANAEAEAFFAQADARGRFWSP